VPLVATATSVAKDGFVIMAAADFDFRILALNWHRAALRAGIRHAFIHSLDDEAFSFLRAAQVPTSNGTASMKAWESTLLRRHIQRALAERHMAAAALANAGINVLMVDTTAVLVKDPTPWFADPRLDDVDMFAMRGGCNAVKRPTYACEMMWNTLFLRGKAPAERRANVLEFVRRAIDMGLIDFYLRWWMGHHCIMGGYNKLFSGMGPKLEGGITAEANSEPVTQNTLVKVRMGAGVLHGLRIGYLPSDKFPLAKPPGTAPPAGYEAAFLKRLWRQPKDGSRTHRLRLDRYDETDFDDMRDNMKAEGLWLLTDSESMLAPPATAA